MTGLGFLLGRGLWLEPRLLLGLGIQPGPAAENVEKYTSDLIPGNAIEAR